MRDLALDQLATIQTAVLRLVATAAVMGMRVASRISAVRPKTRSG